MITITVVDVGSGPSWRAPNSFLKTLSRRPDLLESAGCCGGPGLLVSGLTEAESVRHRLPRKFRLKAPLFGDALATAPAKLSYLRDLLPKTRMPSAPKVKGGFQTYNTAQIVGVGDCEFHAELYQPSLWNDNLYMLEKNNCYAYASGQMPMRSCEPGYNATGQGFGNTTYTIRDMILACQADGLVPLPGYTKPYKLTHLVAALAINGDGNPNLNLARFSGGFHFLRYHWGGTGDVRDNFWAGKGGCGRVMNTDFAGKIIRNPYKATWHYHNWCVAGLFLAPTPLVHVYGPPQIC